jgi:putative restriction endonuclease
MKPNTSGQNRKMTHGDRFIQRFRQLQVWKKKGERAPHKPLLVLLALGRLQQGNERLAPFSLIEKELSRLLVEFGPPRGSVHPEYPFWRLQRENVWEVSTSLILKIRRGNGDPLKSELRHPDVKGGFPEELFLTLKQRPELIRALAWDILRAHFPDSLHPAIALSVGLDLDASDRNPLRDAKFREEVISAWGHRCGFCGYDAKLDNTDLGLEAAHIQWVQAGGPDTLTNGIACCSIHHQALDRGAIGLDKTLRIIVSSRLHGGASLDQHFFRLSGLRLVPPSRASVVPAPNFIVWHRTQVFRGEPRD